MNIVILKSYLKLMRTLNVKPTFAGLTGYRELIEKGIVNVKGGLIDRQAHINGIKKKLEEIKENESTKEVDTLIEMKYLIRERVFKRSI